MDKIMIGVEIGGSGNVIYNYDNGSRKIKIFDLNPGYLIVDEYSDIWNYVVARLELEDVIEYFEDLEDDLILKDFKITLDK